MARAIESLVATAGAAIEKLQAHATSARALEAEARARLDALPPSADDDLPGAVKTRATLRVVCRSLHARLRETLRALEGARAAVDAALLAHHRGKTHVPGVAAAPSAAGSHEGDVRASRPPWRGSWRRRRRMASSRRSRGCRTSPSLGP